MFSCQLRTDVCKSLLTFQKGDLDSYDRIFGNIEADLIRFCGGLMGNALGHFCVQNTIQIVILYARCDAHK